MLVLQSFVLFEVYKIKIKESKDMYTNYILNKIENKYCVYNTIDRNHYQIGYVDYKILEYLLLGASSEYICEQLSISKKDFDNNINQLYSMKFISDIKLKKETINKWNKIYLFRINTSKVRKSKLTIFLEYLLIILSFLALICLSIIFLKHRLSLEMITQFNNVSLGQTVFSLVAIQLVTVFIHEFFHLIFSVNRGANVPEIGVMLYFLSPSGFSDLTQINFIENKESKIMCLVAGLLFNFFLFSLSLTLLLVFDLAILQFILITNLIAIIINLGFYIKLDGYYILQILLDENYLREKAVSKLKLIGKEELSIDNIIYYIIGLSSILYIPILLINIFIGLWSYFV